MIHRRRRPRAARRWRAGTAGLEFAIVALPFLVLLLGTMEASYDFLVASALQSAVQTAARSVQVGSAVRQSSQSLAQFMQQAVCPNLTRLLDCSKLYVSVTAIPSGSGQNYRTYLASNPLTLLAVTSTGNVVCTGAGGQLMLLRAFYLGPTFLGLMVPGFSVDSPVNPGQRVHATFAAAGFVNEYFSGGESGC